MSHDSQITEPISIEQALSDRGVMESTLSQFERQALDREGYVVFPDVIDRDWLDRLRCAFDDACIKNPGAVKESGTRQANDLVNLDPIFESVYTHPRLLAAAYHILQTSFRLGQMNGREPLPGYGQQGLHADWTARSRGEPYRIVTSIWLLDDFTEDNGATRVVPGTHVLLTPPPKSLADPASRHSDQRVIIASAGSVLVFNGHLWHSGTRNKTDRRRRVLQCSFVGRDEIRFTSIKVEDPMRMSPAARYIVGCNNDPSSM